MSMNGCEYPQPGSHCASELEGSYWTGAECACPGSLQNLGNRRCEEGSGWARRAVVTCGDYFCDRMNGEDCYSCSQDCGDCMRQRRLRH